MVHAELLRASGDPAGEALNLGAINDGSRVEATGVPHGEALLAFAEAVLGEDVDALSAARATLAAALGPKALVDAAAVVALFNAIDRIADATGTPLDEQMRAKTTSLRADLDLDRLAG